MLSPITLGGLGIGALALGDVPDQPNAGIPADPADGVVLFDRSANPETDLNQHFARGT